MDDFLSWGEGLKSGKVQFRDVRIAGKNGLFFGEWIRAGNNRYKPDGRGLFVCNKDLIYLGYVACYKWVPESWQIIISETEKAFGVFNVIKTRPGSNVLRVG